MSAEDLYFVGYALIIKPLAICGCVYLHGEPISTVPLNLYVLARAIEEVGPYLKDADVEVIFVKDEAGRVTHLIFRQDGQDLKAKRIK